MWWEAHDGMGWWMVFGGVWMIIFWGALATFIFWGISRLGKNADVESEPRESPLEVAKLRLAQGEITKEEYEELIKSLK